MFDLKKKIHWLVPYQLRSVDELNHVNIASIRLRAAPFQSVAMQTMDLSVGDAIPGRGGVDVLIVGKISVRDRPERCLDWLKTCKEVKASGGKIVLDYTENVIELDSPRARFYQEVLPVADLVVCSSAWLQNSLGHYFSGKSVVIEDAIEVETQPPRNSRRYPVTALWFGHATNLPYLAELLSKWPEKQTQARLVVLTSQEGVEWLQRQGLRKPDNLAIGVYLWSVGNMLAAARDSDLCLIPSDLASPMKAGVSSNRLITSLALGLPTAADMVDSYGEFRDYFVDIRSDNFIALLADPYAYSGIVKKAQIDVVPRFGKEVIGKKWLAALEQL